MESASACHLFIVGCLIVNSSCMIIAPAMILLIVWLSLNFKTEELYILLSVYGWTSVAPDQISISLTYRQKSPVLTLYHQIMPQYLVHRNDNYSYLMNRSLKWLRNLGLQSLKSWISFYTLQVNFGLLLIQYSIVIDPWGNTSFNKTKWPRQVRELILDSD